MQIGQRVDQHGCPIEDDRLGQSTSTVELELLVQRVPVHEFHDQEACIVLGDDVPDLADAGMAEFGQHADFALEHRPCLGGLTRAQAG